MYLLFKLNHFENVNKVGNTVITGVEDHDDKLVEDE